MKKDPTHLTPFQRRVYAAARKIPKGTVTTYQLLAEHIGCGSSQAVGQALKHNPFAPEVPCHRVIRTDRSMGGFAGQTEGPEITRKRRLLHDEGVLFSDAAHVATSHIYAFSGSSRTS